MRRSDRVVLLVLYRFGMMAGFQLAPYLPFYSRGSIHVLLSRMCDDGLIKRHVVQSAVAPDPDRFPLHVFELTPRGDAAIKVHRDPYDVISEGKKP